MFAARTNDGYYALGLEAAQAVREAVELARAGVNMIHGEEELL
jgi:archaeosine-15-forming tRNA-guanine transglycosylase